MAFLRRDPRGKSPYWYGCFRVPGKGQTQRSTGIKASERTRTEAFAMAEMWERQARQLGPAVHLKNRDAVLESFIVATQKAITGDLNETTAREVLNSILQASGTGTIQSETCRKFAERWMEAHHDDLAESSRFAYRSAIRLFLDSLGPLADKPLSAVQTKDVEAFKASRVAAGKSAQTVDKDLKVVRSIFQAAIDQGQIQFNPSRAVKLTSKKNKAETQRVNREIFKPGELGAILAHATGEWLTVALLGRYIGARIGDCVQMRWSNVDLAEGVIRYKDQKTGKDYAVPTHRRLHEHLLSLTSGKESRKFLSPDLAKKVTGGCNGLSAQFIQIMRAAGVDPLEVSTKSVRQVEGKKPRTLSKRSFHSLRHTYNTELANAEVPQEIRRKLVGHASDDVNDIYTHLDMKLFRGAIEKLS